MAQKAVKEKPWYKQWRHTVSIMIEQVHNWGAEKITLIGVKGDMDNHWTMAEWPALLEDLQKGFRHGKIAGLSKTKTNLWSLIEERRVPFDVLEEIIKNDAKPGGKRYVIVASCPNQLYDKVGEICQLGKQNVITAWGRADDMSSLEEVYGAAKDAAKDPSFQIDPAIYSRIPSGDGGDGPFGSVSWWAGSVTRQDVEQMFASVPNGTFLIRNASTAGYTLSFRYFEVHHVKINERDGKYGVCDENFFSEIGEMVEYFRKEDLAFYQKGQSEESKFKLKHGFKDVVPAELRPRRRSDPAGAGSPRTAITTMDEQNYVSAGPTQ
eukprot:m.448767 g.448767  ORF g.448767 m.448767 type:complete len:323 (+) comp19707_c0_seq1:118-1086(+)